jgi:hypothetical protein
MKIENKIKFLAFGLLYMGEGFFTIEPFLIDHQGRL